MKLRKSFGRAPTKAQIAMARAAHVDIRGKSGDEVMKLVRGIQEKNKPLSNMPKDDKPNVIKFQDADLQSAWSKFQENMDSSDLEADFIEAQNQARKRNRE